MKDWLLIGSNGTLLFIKIGVYAKTLNLPLKSLLPGGLNSRVLTILTSSTVLGYAMEMLTLFWERQSWAKERELFSRRFGNRRRCTMWCTPRLRQNHRWGWPTISSIRSKTFTWRSKVPKWKFLLHQGLCLLHPPISETTSSTIHYRISRRNSIHHGDCGEPGCQLDARKGQR